MPQTNEPQKRAYEILKDFSTAMFVTTGADGRPEARPMHIASIEEESGQVWFLTGQGGTLVKEVSAEDDVLLVFQNENSAYLSLRGKAAVVRDQALVRKLWKEPYKVWFPRGAEDPDIALVGVTPIDAEYWDNRGANKLEYFFEAAKAYVKGEKPHVGDTDQHAKTAM